MSNRSLARLNGKFLGPLNLAFTLLVILTSQAFTSTSQDPAKLDAGIRAMQFGEYGRAEVLLREEIASSHSAKALLYLGAVLLKELKYAAAEEAFRSCIQIDSSSAPAHFNRSLALIQLHRTSEAEKELQRVLDLSPDASDAHYNLALLLLRDGNSLKALPHLEQAHLEEPDRTDVTLRLVQCLFLAGAKERADRLAVNFLNAHPEATVNRSLVGILLEAGQPEIAIPAAEGLWLKYPSEDSLRLLGRTYIAAGRPQELIEEIEQDPRAHGLGAFKNLMQQAYTAESEDLIVRHQYAAGRIEIQKAFDQGAKSPQAFLLRGISELGTSGPESALPDLKKAAFLKPGWDSPLEFSGHCYLKLGDYESALKMYREAIQASPRKARNYYHAGLALEKLDRFDEARAQLQKALDINPKQATAHFILGRILEREHKYDKAIGELLAAAGLDPSLDQVDALLSKTYREKGDIHEAELWGQRLSTKRQTGLQEQIQSMREGTDEVLPWQGPDQ